MSSIRTRTSKLTGNKSYLVDYKDMDGIRVSKTLKKYRDAVTFKTQVDHEIAHGIHTSAAHDITLCEAAQEWLDDAKIRGLEPATTRQYESHVRVHLSPAFGNAKLSTITTPRIEKFLRQFMDQQSQAMTKKVLGSLKAILAYAQRHGHAVQNAALPCRVAGSSRRKKPKVIPSKDQIKLIISSAAPYTRPFIMTAIFTGLRSSELRGLRWSNVDLITGQILVREGADELNTFGPPKSFAGTRNVPIGPILVEVLLAWQQQSPSSELDLVFPNSVGRVQSRANITNRIFNPLMRDCDLVNEDNKPLFTFHALRHAAASLMIDKIMNPKRIQTIMGHSSIEMTFGTYGHLFADFEVDQQNITEIEASILQ